jgi:hypothetical protein
LEPPPPDLARWWWLLPLPWGDLRRVRLLGKRHPSSTPCAPSPFIQLSLFTSIPIQAPQICCGVEGVAFISGGLPPAALAVEELCMCTWDSEEH